MTQRNVDPRPDGRIGRMRRGHHQTTLVAIGPGVGAGTAAQQNHGLLGLQASADDFQKDSRELSRLDSTVKLPREIGEITNKTRQKSLVVLDRFQILPELRRVPPVKFPFTRELQNQPFELGTEAKVPPDRDEADPKNHRADHENQHW